MTSRVVVPVEILDVPIVWMYAVMNEAKTDGVTVNRSVALPSDDHDGGSRGSEPYTNFYTSPALRCSPYFPPYPRRSPSPISPNANSCLDYVLYRLHRCHHALCELVHRTSSSLQGDSLTEAWSAGSFAQRMAEAYSRKLDIINRGFGGASRNERC
jgi:hypothetical protein